MAKTELPAESQTLEPEAFKSLYPELFYQRFLEKGIRPDGRAFGGARPVSIGLEAVSTADASALVKIGTTTVLAGLKLEVLAPSDTKSNEGQLLVNVEIAPMSSKESRPYRQTEPAACCSEQVQQLLKSSGAVDLAKLAIPSGKTAWVAYMDIYVLDLDGCLLDACLLGAVACLGSLKSLPSADVGEDGQVQTDGQDLGNGMALDVEGDRLGLLKKESVPLALTCGLYTDKLIADPTAEEEELMQTLLTVTVTGKGRLIGLQMPGGTLEATSTQLQDCIAAAAHRHTTVWPILEAALRGSE